MLRRKVTGCGKDGRVRLTCLNSAFSARSSKPLTVAMDPFVTNSRASGVMSLCDTHSRQPSAAHAVPAICGVRTRA